MSTKKRKEEQLKEDDSDSSQPVSSEETTSDEPTPKNASSGKRESKESDESITKSDSVSSEASDSEDSDKAENETKKKKEKETEGENTKQEEAEEEKIKKDDTGNEKQVKKKESKSENDPKRKDTDNNEKQEKDSKTQKEDKSAKSKESKKSEGKKKDESKKDSTSTQSETTANKPKKPVFDKEKFWAEEKALDISTRRSRYACARYYTLDEIPTWADYFEAIPDPILADPEKKAKKIRELNKLFDMYDSKSIAYLEKKIEKEQEEERKRKEREKRRRKKEEAKKKKKKVDDDEDEDDSDLDSDSESLETQRKKFYAWRAPPEPDEGDLITFASEPQFNFEPNEEINQKVSLWQGDITTLEVDAIVNAANEECKGGGGVDGAIHAAAGPTLYQECVLLNGCPTGMTKITRGHNLPAQYILHTVGPMVRSPELPLPKTKLQSCYQTCLDLVLQYEIRTVAFCCVSTGIYGYNLEMATHTALTTVRKWLENEENRKKIDRIIFCVFSDRDRDCYEEMMQLYFPPIQAPTTVVWPCSVKDRWQVFVETLVEGPPIKKVDQLAEAIQKVSGRGESLDCNGLVDFFMDCFDSKERSAWFKKELPKIIQLANSMPKVFTVSKKKSDGTTITKLQKVNLLVQSVEDTLRFTQEQVASLLACAFFGLLPQQQFHAQKFDDPNFLELYSRPTISTNPASTDEEQSKKKKKSAADDESNAELESLKRNQYAKLKCLLHYFQRVTEQIPNENEMIIRRKVFIEPLPDWKRDENFIERFVDVFESTQPMYLCSSNEVQLIAVNKLVGSDVLSYRTKPGRSDIRFFQSPELFVVRLFASQMLPHEAIEVAGVETFCTCDLEGNSMKFLDTFEDKSPTDTGIRRNRLLLVDPLIEFDKDVQLRAHNIVREIQRLYCALHEDFEPVGQKIAPVKRKKEEGTPISQKPPPIVVAYDDWGCDNHFGGDPFIKALIVHLAVTKLNSIAYDADPKWVKKHAPPRPELHCFQSRAANDLIKTVAVYHREQVAPKHVMAKIFKQIQQEYSSDNLCVRMATIFSSWRETLKQMQKERERERKAEQKRFEEMKKKQKLIEKEQKKAAEKAKKAAAAGEKQKEK